MTIVQCTLECHASQILEIFNDAILHSTALFDYKPRTVESMFAWFEAKEQGRFPVFGLEDANGKLLGFASYGPFRDRPAYKYSVEHSVYVHKDHRGRGLGRRLMKEIIHSATVQDYHLLVGGIEATNASSIALHQSLGFTHAGTIRETGYKFGQWLDVSFYQLILKTPAHPNEN